MSTEDDLAALPRVHVLRPSLPWRDGPVLTECGHLPDGDTPVLGREEFITRLKKWGQARTSLTTCMTCWQTASRHPSTWETSPVTVMAREAGRAVARDYPPAPVRDDPASRQIHLELLALAELVGRHREEFRGIVAGLEAAPSLDDARRNRSQRRQA